MVLAKRRILEFMLAYKELCCLLTTTAPRLETAALAISSHSIAFFVYLRISTTPPPSLPNLSLLSQLHYMFSLFGKYRLSQCHILLLCPLYSRSGCYTNSHYSLFSLCHLTQAFLSSLILIFTDPLPSCKYILSLMYYCLNILNTC